MWQNSCLEEKVSFDLGGWEGVPAPSPSYPGHGVCRQEDTGVYAAVKKSSSLLAALNIGWEERGSEKGRRIWGEVASAWTLRQTL